MTELFNALDLLGHNTFVVSTNGMNESLFRQKNKMVDSVLGLQQFGVGKKALDLDFCFTVPQNFPARFLGNSKVKAAIYAYEYRYWPPVWKQYYKYVDMFFAPSDFAAEVFCNNGVPEDKVYVIEHGVDIEKFNPSISPIRLNTQKSYRFLSVCAPHYRKKLHILLNAYCQAFTKNDDVALVLKTKVYKHSDGDWNAQTNPKGRKGFEVVLGDIFRDLHNRYGKDLPEIEIIDKRVDNVASIFNACNTHITSTGSECFGIPSLEVMNCGGITGNGMISIAPRYSGQLQFMNDNNSLLIDTKLVKARPEEQYWGIDSRNMSGEPDVNHTAELMLRAYKEYDLLLNRFRPEMKKTVRDFSWINATNKIISAISGKCEHYKVSTYKGLL
jgi:glycosyltransferase involved in cell wall biosynthesis